MAQLARRAAIWTLTLKELRAAKVLPELSGWADDVFAVMADAQKKVEVQRVATFVLQDRVVRELARADTALAQIGQARQRAADSLFVRESSFIWELRPLPLGTRPAAFAASFADQLDALRSFAIDQSDWVALYAVVLVGLI